MWDGYLWNPINSETGKIDSSVLPADVVYKEDISALNEIETLKKNVERIYFVYLNTTQGITPSRPISWE